MEPCTVQSPDFITLVAIFKAMFPLVTCVTCSLYVCFRRGPNKWRDQFLPIDILDDWIKAKGLPPAQWAPDGKSVTIGSEEYTLNHFGN